MANLEKLLSIAMLAPMDDPADATCRWGAPILFWGPPGIGKSGRVEAAGAAAGLPVETLYLSTLQPEDLSGIPMPDGVGGVVNVCSLSQVHTLTASGKGVLFLDELTTARPAVQGAGLGVVYNRRVAGKPLPGRVRVVGAANPPEEAAGGWTLAPPMANRLLHFEVSVPDPDEWSTWLLSGANEEVIPIERGEETITSNWNDSWAKTRGLGAGFIKRNRDRLYKMPKEGSRDRTRAWPSPRSWEVALRCVATAEALSMKEYGLDLLMASCGEGAAAEWAEWVAYANLPDPKEMLEDGWKPDKRRLDVAFAAYSSAISYALGKTDKTEQTRYAVLAWKLLTGAKAANLLDLTASPARALIQAGYHSKHSPEIASASKELILSLAVDGLAESVRR